MGVGGSSWTTPGPVLGHLSLAGPYSGYCWQGWCRVSVMRGVLSVMRPSGGPGPCPAGLREAGGRLRHARLQDAVLPAPSEQQWPLGLDVQCVNCEERGSAGVSAKAHRVPCLVLWLCGRKGLPVGLGWCVRRAMGRISCSGHASSAQGSALRTHSWWRWGSHCTGLCSGPQAFINFEGCRADLVVLKDVLVTTPWRSSQVQSTLASP